MGHQPGQYLRIGVIVDGIHHWRAYSLTSEPGRADGCIGITPKLVEAGKVSPYLVRDARPGEIVRLGGVEGTFLLPRPPAREAALPQRRQRHHADHEHVAQPRAAATGSAMSSTSTRARTAEEVIFGGCLRALDGGRTMGFRLNLRSPASRAGSLPPTSTGSAPTGASDHTFLSGPREMLDSSHRATGSWRATRSCLQHRALPAA